MGAGLEDFKAEIHLVQASHSTEGKPRLGERNHNYVITELGKEQVLIPSPELLLPLSVLEALVGEQ